MADPNFEQVYMTWVQQFYEDVYRWCFRFTKNQEEARDLTQETYLAAFRNIHKFRHESSPRTWLLTIASHTCIKYEKKKKSPVMYVSDETLFETSAETEYMRRAESEWVWTAITQLKSKERMSMILYYDENLSYEEISKILDVPVHQVKNFLHRARMHVKKRLESEE